MNKGKVEARRIAVIPEGPRGRGEETKLGTLYPQVAAGNRETLCGRADE